MEHVVSDFRIAIRGLRRRPGFAATAVTTLALGIAGATAIFSLLYGTLLKPLPYAHPEDLVRVTGIHQGGGSGGHSIPNFIDMRERTNALSAFVAYSHGSVNFATGGAPERMRSLRVTVNFLPALGVTPLRGRGFTDGEDRDAALRVAVITHDVWTARFGRDGAILGRHIRLNGVPHQVVGVLGPDFWFPNDPQFIVPFEWTPREALDETRGNRQLESFGRLAPGVSPEAAAVELQAIFADLAELHPNANTQGWSIRVAPFEELFNRSSEPLRLLVAAVGLVLLIGCVNVANLMLVRAERRQVEFAVRAAMGAGRAQLARTFLVETLALAMIAGIVGTWLGWLGTRALISTFGSSFARSEEVEFSLPIVLFALAITIVTALVVGLVPALRSNPRRLSETLRSGGRGLSAAGGRLREGLVVTEVAFAVALAVAGSLLFSSFWRLGNVDAGVDRERTIVFRTELPPSSYPGRAEIAAYYQRAVTSLQAIPGVEHVGVTQRVPMGGGYNITSLRSPDDSEIQVPFVEIRGVTPGFFDAAGIRLLRGRGLTDGDGRTEARVVLVSEDLATSLFPDGRALGKRIVPFGADSEVEIVGVVNGVREFGLSGGRRPAIYWPYPVWGTDRGMAFVLRSAIDPMSQVPAVRRALADIDPTVPPYGFATFDEVARGTMSNLWIATSLVVIFGTLAVGLAALGVFAVLGFAVEQRRREVGIRIALGATVPNVTGLVVRRGLWLVVIGLVGGTAAALAGSRLFESLLYDISPGDPATLVRVGVAVLITGALAALLPALRAARVDPLTVLREE